MSYFGIFIKEKAFAALTQKFVIIYYNEYL